MNKRILITTVSIFTSIVLILSSFFICAYGIGLEKPIDVRYTEKEKTPKDITPTVTEDFFTEEGFRVSVSGTTPATYGEVELIERGGAVIGYSVGDNTVYFHSSIGGGLTETLSLNGKAVASVFYEKGDMLPDLYLLGKTSAFIAYGEGGRREAILVGDGSLEAVYGEDGLITESILSGEVEHSFEYENGRLIREVINGTVYDYSADRGTVDGGGKILVLADSLTYERDGRTYRYTLGHVFGGKRYVTEIAIDGVTVAEYQYIADRVVTSFARGERIDYILGRDLSHVGMIRDGEIYYFIYDTRGIIYSVIDESGAPVAFYGAAAFSTPEVTLGDGMGNIILDPERIFHGESGAIFSGSEITLTYEGAVYCLDGSVKPLSDSPITSGGGFGEGGAISFETALRSKVLEEAMLYLEGQGYAAAANLPAVNGEGEIIDVIDLYILNSECADASIKNALSGDRVYSIVAYTDDVAAARLKLTGYTAEGSGISVEYFDLYKPTLGDLIFDGQFIYGGYLISYHAEGGVITYRTLENDVSLYSGHGNVYNYDTAGYAFIAGEGFSADNEDYTRLIPGVNREQYDVVESYVEEAVEICSSTGFDTLGYYDTTYYDSYVNSAMGDTLDLLDGIDPNAMVELSSDGGITVSAIPFFDRSSTRKQLVVAVAGAVVATVVAGIISVTVPGSGAVFIAVLKVAVTQGIIAAGTSIVVSVGIDLAKEHLFGQEINEALEERLFRYLVTAINAYSVGAISGAIAGNIGYRASTKVTGDTLSTKLTANDKLQLKLDALDKQYASLIDDSWTARLEYEKLRMNIQSAYNSGKATKTVVACSRRDNFIISNTMKLFGAGASWAKSEIGGSR